jgi:hypothetical protein
MKKLLSAALLMAACVTQAHAETYNFSYSFDDGTSVVTGSLNGHLHGELLENIANVHVSLNGVAFTGPLFIARWNDATGNWDNSQGAVVSTNAAKNNFVFADAKVPDSIAVNNYFYFVNSGVIGKQAFAVNYNNNDSALDEPTHAASWTLVAAPVPEPTSAAMLLAGLGLSAAIARRRKA